MKWWQAAFPRFLILLIYCIASGEVVQLTVGSHSFHANSRYSLSSMVYGTADKPFVYRMLAPGIVRIATELTPSDIKASITSNFLRTVHYRQLKPTNGYESGFEVEFMYALLLMFFSLVGFAFAMRALFRHAFPHMPLAADWAPPFVLLALPVMVSYFVYNFPSLLLLALGTLCIMKRRIGWFVPVFILACLAKETCVLLLVIATVVWWRDMGRFRLGAFVGGMSVIWLIIYAGIRILFRDNPGDIVELHFFDYNLPYFITPSRWVHFNAFFLPNGLNLFALLAVAGLVCSGWRDCPSRYRLAFAVVAPIQFGLVIVGGIVDEMRNYFELVPLTFVLMLSGFCQLYSKLSVLPNNSKMVIE